MPYKITTFCNDEALRERGLTVVHEGNWFRLKGPGVVLMEAKIEDEDVAAEIKAQAKAARDKIKRARGAVDVAVAELRVVQAMCEHPNQFRTSHMGETCMHCPDCGWES